MKNHKWIALALISTLSISSTGISPNLMAANTTPKTINKGLVNPNHDTGSNIKIFLPLLATSGNKSSETTTAKLNYELGKKYIYQMASTTKSESRQQALSNSQANVNEMKISYKANITPVTEKQNGSWLLQLTIESPIVTYTDENNVIQNSQDTDLTRDLAIPVYYEQLTNGQVIGIQFDVSDSSESINLKRGLISALQIQLNQNGNTANQEIDVAGAYRPHYSRQSASGTLEITKERTQDDFSVFALSSDDEEGKLLITDKSSAEFDNVTGLIKNVTTNNKIIAVEDNSIPFATDTGVITDTDGIATSDGITDTYGAHIVLKSQGEITLRLLGVDIAEPLALPNENYSAGNLMATPTKVITPTIDLDLVIEILESNPSELMTFTKLANAMKYYSPELLPRLRNLFPTHQNKPEWLSTVIGGLISAESDQIQKIILDDIVLNKEQNIENKQNALRYLTLLKRPSGNLINVLTDLSRDSKSPLQEAATLTLGANANALSKKQPIQAKAITTLLEKQLQQATTDRDILTFLDALGNAGQSMTVPTLANYLEHPSELIRLSALDSFRKMPVSAQKLTERAKFDKSAFVRHAAYKAYPDVSDKKDISNSKIDGLEINSNWARRFGSGDINAELSAALTVYEKPGIAASAIGELKVSAWQHSKSLIKGQALTDAATRDGVTVRIFGGYVWLLGNKVINKETVMACNDNKAGVLSPQTSVRFFTFDKTFPVAGIPVNIRLAVDGNYALDYTYSWTACDYRVLAKASVGITPKASTSISGKAGVNLALVRGGLGAEIKIMNGSMPIKTEGTVQPIQPKLRGCVNVQTTLQPIGGSIFAWYQTRKYIVLGKWSNEQKKNIWSWNGDPYNWTVLSKCIDAN